MEKLTKPVLKAVGVILALLAITLIVRSVAEEKQIDRIFGLFAERAVRLWTEPLFRIGGLHLSPVFLLKAAVFLVLLAFFSRATRKILQNQILAHTSLDPGLQYALDAGTGYLVFVLGLIIRLQSMGVNLPSLAFLTGIIGVGVGFGMQDIVSNFVFGFDSASIDP